ncbi:MAG: alpha/beta fold hydrolase [Rhodothalassiaceae bacterium]
MAFPEAQTVTANGLCFAAYCAGPRPDETDKPPIVFLHGWPELAYSWRHQLAAVAAAGYPALAFDQRGYGGSDKPEGLDHYTMAALTGDVAGVLDAFGIERAVVIGHDWGALVTWALPFYQPARLHALAGLCVPFRPNWPADPIAMCRKRYGERMYIVRFQQQGACEPVLERDVARTFRFLMRQPRSGRATEKPLGEADLNLVDRLDTVPEEQWPGTPFLSDADMAVFVQAFSAGGFTAPLHWYGNFTANWQDMKRYQPDGGPPPRIDLPALMITADKDAACPPALADGMERYIPDLTRVDLTGVGHWLQQEQPEPVNAAILAWLDALPAKG